jgi:murein DD-endopeptidase MepM/ murein hydrolase activator NlpD
MTNAEAGVSSLVDSGTSAAATADGPSRDRDTTPLKDIPTGKDGVALDVTYPSLAGWTHPVADSTELVPTRPQRKFGAKRYGDGEKKPGCKKRGHCGVDLDGPRGRTIVSVKDGTVVHIERKKNGSDGFSGRYVKIEHDGGVFTAYMHLDAIAPDLAVGDKVTAGQFIGRLGRSGIRHGEPHLHFNLQIPYGKTSLKFLDSTPFLQRAKVVPDPAPKREDNRNKS